MFSAMQYGKLISYWKCRVTNSADIGAVQCDCEKILMDNSDGLADNLSTRSQVNDKIEDWFSSNMNVILENNNELIIKTINPHHYHLHLTRFTGSIFQPPKI